MARWRLTHDSGEELGEWDGETLLHALAAYYRDLGATVDDSRLPDLLTITYAGAGDLTVTIAAER